ncbi:MULTISPECIES: DUF6850 family outer membrane beta-barrel protein [Butyricimonas]|uniref:DUF6850 family outer membrane beta-barrel protein n=1 Tax=Butyricimonas TaxID=574697 RepID=UPI001D07BEAB|nr:MULTISPECIES: DUF6850 family outer membrane beta-barrel protein [Butyricimonas]MCB6971504.1 hypothetical protein [Butyricimonas synergistica]MCG4518218.1 hypothetical protein [Butyricimonas sp. DFI.6.44]
MRSLFILIFSLTVLFSSSRAQDTLSVNTRTRVFFSPGENFVSQAYRNPALQYYAHSFSLTELQIGWEQTSADKALLPQLGSKTQNFNFNVSSYISLRANSKTWGNAYYKNGKRNNVQWNETSDFLTVYPYVMADTLGGNLKTEEYYFAGGYAQAGKHFTWGIFANYRALIEYRNRDPRPKNVVSDLKGSVGISARITRRYDVGLAIHAGKYKQTNDVKYYNELGTLTEYHLFGLGTDSRRFYGKNSSVYYNGHRYGASVELFPRAKKGLSAAVEYERFTFEKIISTLNNLPLNELNQDEIKAEVAYMTRTPREQWGLKLNGSYRNRKGTENLFGDPTTGVYPQIGSTEQLSVKRNNLSLSFLYGREYREKQFSWNILPQAEMNTFKMTYLDPARLMKLNDLTGRMNVSLAKSIKKSTFRLDAEGEYRYNTDAELQLTDIDETTRRLLEPVNTVYANLSTDSWASDISLRWDYTLSRGDKGIFIKINWRHDAFKGDLQRETLQAHCGFTF